MNNQQNNQKGANQQNVNKSSQTDFQKGGQNKSSSSQQPHEKQYDRQESSKTQRQ